MISLPRGFSLKNSGKICEEPPPPPVNDDGPVDTYQGEDWDLDMAAARAQSSTPSPDPPRDDAFLNYTRKCVEAIMRDPLLARLESVRRKFGQLSSLDS